MALAERIHCAVLHFGAGFPWEKGKCPNREAMGSCCDIGIGEGKGDK